MTCKDCKDRYIGCHDRCEKYQQFKKENEIKREQQRIQQSIKNSYYMRGNK